MRSIVLILFLILNGCVTGLVDDVEPGDYSLQAEWTDPVSNVIVSIGGRLLVQSGRPDRFEWGLLNILGNRAIQGSHKNGVARRNADGTFQLAVDGAIIWTLDPAFEQRGGRSRCTGSAIHANGTRVAIRCGLDNGSIRPALT